MRPFIPICSFAVVAAVAGALSTASAQLPVHTDLRPKVVRRAEGQKRVLPDGRSILLKVGPSSTGSGYLFMGYEDLPPGSAIPVHHHEIDEEILIVHRGRVQVVLEHDSTSAAAGDVVFLPPRSRVSMRVIGSDTASIFFVFPRGSVERCFQFVGRSEGQTAPSVLTRADTLEVLRSCQMTYF